MKLLSIFLVLILSSCGGDDDGSETDNLTLEQTGTAVVTIPGDEQVNIEFLTSDIPEGVEADFTIEMGFLVSPMGGVDLILQENIGAYNNQTLDDDVLDSFIIEEFGEAIEPIDSGLVQSARLEDAKKIVVHVSADRAIALYSQGVTVGGFDRYFFVWGLFSRE